MMFINKNLLKDYLDTIKSIQECNEVGLSPYSLNNERIKLHRELADYMGLKSEYEYLKLKEIFSNMDLICSLYSECEEWKLKNDFDVTLMTDNLYKFLSSQEAEMFIKGNVSNIKQLPCFHKSKN